MIINILGCDYNIIECTFSSNKVMHDNNYYGYCDTIQKKIYIADFSEEQFDMEKDRKDAYKKLILRHEVIHAFLTESGLGSSSFVSESPWATNEEMVDWIALQFNKIKEVFIKLGI